MAKTTPKQPFNKADTAFLRLTTGNHGIPPEVRFDPQKKLWEINIHPTGPGVGPILYFGDGFMSRLVESYLTTKGLASLAVPPSTTGGTK